MISPSILLPAFCSVRSWVSWLVLLCLLTGCGEALPPENQALKKRMADAISHNYTQQVGDTVALDMAAITDFPWDTLYAFTVDTGTELVSKAIGTTWPENIPFLVDDDEKLFVFMNKGHITDYIEFRRNDDPHDPSSVHFSAYFSLGELFTPATAKFRMIKECGKYGYPDSICTIDVVRPKAIPLYRHSNPLSKFTL
jgi:hypothetical protein